VDPLSALLELTAAEKLDRGLVHTPQEISQQPDTWLVTSRSLEEQLRELQQFLTRQGIGASI
jgi:tagatose-6-phosphate ketose/aldose isomerase